VGKVYKDDIGTKRRIDIGDSTAEATVYFYYVQKPDKTEVRWPAEGNCTILSDQVLEYVTIEGDQDQAGTYILQAYLEYPDWQGKGESDSFVVYAKFRP